MNYNDFRPHSSLDGMTPEVFAAQWQDKTTIKTLKNSP
jgi:transposase InsO family protein